MKITEERDGARIIHEFDEMTPEKRPQDVPRNRGRPKFETLEHGAWVVNRHEVFVVARSNWGSPDLWLRLRSAIAVRVSG